MQKTRANEFRNPVTTAIAVLALALGGALVARTESASHERSGAVSAERDLPLSFEPNRGQSENGVQFVARGPGYSLFLNGEGSSFQFSPTLEVSSLERSRSSFSIRFVGPRKNGSHLLGGDQQSSQSSYFIGSDPTKWLTGIPNFARVGRRGVYDGIDITYRGIQGELEYEFKVAPHAKPETIALEIIGAQNLRKSPQGDLIFTVAGVEMRLHKPNAYQEVNGAGRTVASQYTLRKNWITFGLGNYNPAQTLFINPVLSYSGYLKQQEANSAPLKIDRSLARSTRAEQFTRGVVRKHSPQTNHMEIF